MREGGRDDVRGNERRRSKGERGREKMRKESEDSVREIEIVREGEKGKGKRRDMNTIK